MTDRSLVLKELSRLIGDNSQAILSANAMDVEAYSGDDKALYDRLKVDDIKIANMMKSLLESAEMPLPDGKVLYEYHREDGLHISNATVPFGTILIIYESRPDVTVEAAAMAFMSGNKILLKGGKESKLTNLFLTSLWHQALRHNGYESSWVNYLDLTRQETQALIADKASGIDLIIPRGGDALIQFVTNQAYAPVMVSGRGNNFMYLHADADTDMAIRLMLDGKERISVCNALDKIIIHRSLATETDLIKRLIFALTSSGIECTGNEDICCYSEDIKNDQEESTLYEEFLAKRVHLILADCVEEAIEMINKYSGGHSSVIVSGDDNIVGQFMNKVDSAAVYHNASSRFTDGSQFGLGGEIAISTQKLHFRGPVGISQLVTNKWFVFGNGQIRK